MHKRTVIVVDFFITKVLREERLMSKDGFCSFFHWFQLVLITTFPNKLVMLGFSSTILGPTDVVIVIVVVVFTALFCDVVKI